MNFVFSINESKFTETFLYCICLSVTTVIRRKILFIVKRERERGCTERAFEFRKLRKRTVSVRIMWDCTHEIINYFLFERNFFFFKKRNV